MVYIYYTRVSKLEGKESNCVRMGIKGVGGGVGGGVGVKGGRDHGGTTICTDFKRDKNGDPADSIHCGKCKFPTLIAY